MAPAATAAIEALLQALGGRPGASAAELADGAGIGRSTANKIAGQAGRRGPRRARGGWPPRRPPPPGPLDAAGAGPHPAGQGP